MPRQLDQLPPDATSLARRLAALEKEVKELRAARRMGTATVGRLRVYSADGQMLLAELGPTDGGGAGLWTRGFQDTDNTAVSSELASGQVRFRAVADDVNEVSGSVAYNTIPETASDLTLTSGAILASDWRAIVDLGSTAGGDVPTVLVSGFREVSGTGESGPCNMDLAGVLTASNIAYGTASITPSAANTPTSSTVSGLNVQGSTFFAFTSPVTSRPGSTGTPDGVTGTSANNVGANGVTVWLTRQNTTTTSVNWLVIGI